MTLMDLLSKHKLLTLTSQTLLETQREEQTHAAPVDLGAFSGQFAVFRKQNCSPPMVDFVIHLSS